MRMGLPLDDVRVIDLTVARAGPTCVRHLADWGADVIRVEAPGMKAFVGEERHGPDLLNLHRNKRAITLNLKTDAGRDLLLQLVEGADVVVENMRPAVKHKLGFDYDTLRARNPRVILASISGFGQDGPYGDRGGVDQIAQGMGGLMSVTGLPGNPPTRVGIPISDLSAGMHLAIGVLVALHDRSRTGEGQWVQTSLLEAMVSTMDFQAARWTVSHEVPETAGNHHPIYVPMGCYETADGYINIAGSGGRLLRNFCAAIGLPDLPRDERFDTGAKRHANREELNAIVAERLKQRTTAEWVESLNEVGVPAGPVNKMDEVFADPQVRHLGLAAPVEHPELGTIEIVRNAVTTSRHVNTVRTHSPNVGEHTDEVLTELGLPAERIAELRDQGVI